MKPLRLLVIFLAAAVMLACTPRDNVVPAQNVQKQTAPTPTASPVYVFSPEDLNGLVMVDSSFLDGRLEATGRYVEGASILVFEKDYMWATGSYSPYAVYGHITKWAWKLDKNGVIQLRTNGDPDSIDDHKHKCQIKVIKTFAREFTTDGLPEKLRLELSCNDGLQPDTRVFHLPLPFNPSMMYGTTLHWANDSDGRNDALFQGDHFRMRKEYQGDRYIGPLLDPYKGGAYQNSLHIDVTDIDRVQDQPDTVRTIGKERLFLFKHSVPKHGKLVSFSYCPINFTPPGDDGYLHQRIDRFELCSIYRITNLTKGGERPLTVRKSTNANGDPFHSALGFD
ncbi:MAG: hypothetical protein L3J65_00495 [Robiginitomaculum sp.]|nr:hypothetical protein [Robiginitomaculum sp.]